MVHSAAYMIEEELGNPKVISCTCQVERRLTVKSRAHMHIGLVLDEELCNSLLSPRCSEVQGSRASQFPCIRICVLT